MGMRTVRAAVPAVLAILVAGLVGTSPAAARPAPAPTGLAVVVAGHEDGSYDIDATWDAVPNATSYRVALTKGGATLASASVTTSAWSPTVTGSPGIIALSVRAVVGRKRGRTATLAVTLPDATAPHGSYSSDWDINTGIATITQQALTDNVSGNSDISRTVDWGDETPPEAWAAGTTLTHSYPATEQRYEPTVTLEDEAHNVRVVTVPAMVVNDTAAPTGSFSTSPATAWADLTSVMVTQSHIGDNWTPDALVTRSVDWGDGTTTNWTTGTNLAHVYVVAGSFTPIVTLTDEAHNVASIPTSAVEVATDTTRPILTLRRPRALHSVNAWRTLRGKSTDDQSGVKKVTMRAVEKRTTAWYGYDAVTQRWVKAATRTRAYARSEPFVTTPDTQDRWSATLKDLRKGTLYYRARATDMVGNRSALVSRHVTLTRR